MTDWTNEQINVFDASGNVLVYASAGSGKTSVMVKKIVDDVVKGVPVKDILVVSYTKASATDMRLKIINALFDVAKDENVKNVDKIREEIDNLPFAEIGTMDSFLGRIIKENFEFLKISPKAQQMDETESKDMKRRALKKVMNDEYEKQAEDFIRVASRASGIVDDTPLSEIVLRIYDAISINPRPDEFKAMLLSSVTDNPDSVYGKIILDFYRDLAAETLPFVKRTIDVTALNDAPVHAAALRYSVETLEQLSDVRTANDAKKIIERYVKPNFRGGKPKISDEDKALVAAARDKTAEIIENLSEKLFVDYTNYNVNDAKEFMRVVMRVVEEFDREYERLKKRENKIDFADLSKYAVKLLKDESRREEIRQKFSLVFVDEYQDINPLQEEILLKITDGNLFMVGDVKQSIYAFRNADSKIFTDKKKSFETGKARGSALPMTENFRSENGVLEFVDRVFSGIMTLTHGGCDYKNESLFIKDGFTGEMSKNARIMLVKNDPSREETEISGVYSVMSHERNSSLDEISGYTEGSAVAEEIRKIIGSKYVKSDGTPLEYKDIAVLFRKRGSGSDGFLRALTDNGIPYASDGFIEGAGKRYIKELSCFIKAVDNSLDDIAFVGFLRSHFAKFSDEDVAKVVKYYKSDFVYDAVKKCAEKTDELSEKCRIALAFLWDERKRAAFCGVKDFLYEVVGTTAFDAYVLAGENGKDDMTAVRKFISDGAAYPDLQSFAAAIRNGDDDDFTNPDDEADAVKILTVHASKGLEFPVVFLARCDVNWGGGTKAGDIVFDRTLGAGIKLFDEETRLKADSLAYTAIKLEAKRREADENIRLLYVALTRAKNRIYVTGTTNKALEKKFDFPTPVISSMKFSDLITFAVAMDDGLYGLIDFVEPTVENPNEVAKSGLYLSNGDDKTRNALKKVLDFVYPFEKSSRISPKYTVTEINRLVRDEENEGFTPSMINPSSDNRRTGIAYHAVMENIDFSTRTVSEINYLLKNLVENGVLQDGDEELVDANDILRCIQSPVIQEGIKGRYIREKSFMLSLHAGEVGGDSSDDILVQGTIDLAFFGEENVIIDFKYSGLSDERLAEKYARQLKTYKIAVMQAYDVKVDKILLYSFKTGHFIDIK